VCILYIISEYTYLQSILISCRCIPKLNVCFVWKPILVNPSKKNHDIFYLFSKFYQYWGCETPLQAPSEKSRFGFLNHLSHPHLGIPFLKSVELFCVISTTFKCNCVKVIKCLIACIIFMYSINDETFYLNLSKAYNMNYYPLT